MKTSAGYPITPDGRYFVVAGRLWRMSNPELGPEQRDTLVKQLMAARRRVGEAMKGRDDDAETQARRKVHEAKVALGERGPAWWSDGQPDFNRRKVAGTPYADWYAPLADNDRPD